MSFLHKIHTRSWLFIAFALLTYGCAPDVPQSSRIEARPAQPTIDILPGEHWLELGGWRWVNRWFMWRDGLLYIPEHKQDQKLPLLVWLHQGGGNAERFRHLFPVAEAFGMVILALDARHNTWDGIDSPFGPDVLFIDQALRYTFERVAIDPQHIALGGLSDGASYALALGRSNGDVFTHLMAFAPWRLEPPSPPVGKPKVLVAHGTRDTVYPVFLSRQFTVPVLKEAGYDVSYFEFDGPHWIPEGPARKAFAWFVAGSN